MSNCQDNSVLFRGQDVCWSLLTISLNNFTNPPKTASRCASQNCSPAASKQTSDPFKTSPKCVPPRSRCCHSESTSWRPTNVQSLNCFPPVDALCSFAASLTPKPLRSSKLDVPPVRFQELLSKSEFSVNDEKKCSVVPPVDSVGEQPTVRLIKCSEVISNPAAPNDSSTECKSPVKMSAVNPDVIVTAVDKVLTYGDKKMATVDSNKTAAGVTATDEILIDLKKTLAAPEATTNVTEGTITTVAEEKINAAKVIVTVDNDRPKLTNPLVLLTETPLCLVDDNDIKSTEVLVVPDEEAIAYKLGDFFVDSEYEMRIKQIDDNIVSYSKYFISAMLFFALFRVMF